MEHVTVLQDIMEHCARITAKKELLVRTVLEHVTVQWATIATILMGSVLNVQMTLLERNVSSLVSVIRMGLHSALILMEGASVSLTGSAQSVN